MTKIWPTRILNFVCSNHVVSNHPQSPLEDCNDTYQASPSPQADVATSGSTSSCLGMSITPYKHQIAGTIAPKIEAVFTRVFSRSSHRQRTQRHRVRAHYGCKNWPDTRHAFAAPLRQIECATMQTSKGHHRSFFRRIRGYIAYGFDEKNQRFSRRCRPRCSRFQHSNLEKSVNTLN